MRVKTIKSLLIIPKLFVVQFWFLFLFLFFCLFSLSLHSATIIQWRTHSLSGTESKKRKKKPLLKKLLLIFTFFSHPMCSFPVLLSSFKYISQRYLFSPSFNFRTPPSCEFRESCWDLVAWPPDSSHSHTVHIAWLVASLRHQLSHWLRGIHDSIIVRSKHLNIFDSTKLRRGPIITIIFD